nr:cyanophycin synthetase [Bacillus ectoiniformans]
MIRGLQSIKRPAHRLEFHELKNNITVIDDTVHAHGPAMKAALDVLAEVGKHKKVAVLGSMPAHKDQMIKDHEEIGEYAASKGIDMLFTYGNYSAHISQGAINAGMSEDQVKHFSGLQKDMLHEELLKFSGADMTILVKGASRLNMLETVQYLRKEIPKKRK